MKNGLIALLLGAIIIGGGAVGVNALSNEKNNSELNKNYIEDLEDEIEDKIEIKILEQAKNKLEIKDNEWKTYDELEDIIEEKLGIDDIDDKVDIEDLIEKKLGLDDDVTDYIYNED